MRQIILSLFILAATAAVLQADAPPVSLPAAVNAFGFQALSGVSATSQNANVSLSPVSLHIALDMACSGAAGKTRDAMASALGISGLTYDQLGGQALDLLGSLGSPNPEVTVTVADSLWTDTSTSLMPSYVSEAKNSFNADVENLNLQSPDSIARINQWVSDKTNGRIDHILDKVDPSIRSILANALYFKGSWTTPFLTRRTALQPFHAGGTGADVTVPLMDRAGSFDYLEDAENQMVKLPFGKDGRFGFVVVLPKQADALISMVKSLDGPTFAGWISQLTPRHGEVELPRFKVKCGLSMNAILKQMGMALAFDPLHADFSRMIAPPNRFFIGFVQHDTFLNVDEQGAEAAAATVIGMSGSAMMRPPPDSFKMIVDHPFLCAIVDSKTGVVLFEALIYNPEG